MDKYRFITNLEVGFRLEVVNNNGFVKETYNLTQDEFKDNIHDICKLSTESEEEKDKLLDILRAGYSYGNLKNITFCLKDKDD